jgi:ankyrin repeat protein
MNPEQEIFEAITAGDLERVRNIINTHPAAVQARNDNGDSPLLAALYAGQAEISSYLMSKAPSLTIYEAAATGRIERVKELLEEDPRLLNYLSHDGWTPLHLAAFFGQSLVVEFLIDLGADMHAVSQNSNTAMPLHSALASGKADVALLLIEKGADISAAQLTHGYTPLHYAAASGLETVGRKLLEMGADPNVAALDGKTPIDMATEKGHTEFAALLRESATNPQG